MSCICCAISWCSGAAAPAGKATGTVLIDGAVQSGRGTGPTTNFTGSIGELSGTFADIRANSVSGDITVLRRAPQSVADQESTPDAVSAPDAETNDDGAEAF